MPHDSQAWASAALRASRPNTAGLSREQASRHAVAICKEAAETGQTVNAHDILGELMPIIARKP